MKAMRIKAPAGYGPVKKALFNLGVKAYSDRKNPFKRELYDSAAMMMGGPLLLICPKYEYGGIRTEVELAVDARDGIRRRPDPASALSYREVDRYFRLAEGEVNTDLTLLGTAVRNFDRRVRLPALDIALYVSSRALFFGFGAMGLYSAAENGFGCQSGFYLLSGLVSSNVLGQIYAGRVKGTAKLLNFITRTDDQVISHNIHAMTVGKQTKNLLYYYLGGRGGSVAEAVKRMPVINKK